jgi:hypothetical protein
LTTRADLASGGVVTDPQRASQMVDFGYFRGLGVAQRDAPAVPTAVAAGEPRRLDRAVDFSNGQIAALFVTLAVITSIPILLYPWPPLADYMNHLARMRVIAAIDGDPDLSRFYQVQWQLIPNLMMDLIVPTLQRVANIYLAGQIYTIMSFVLILSGTLALNRQLYGHWSVLPLIAFPLLYNNVFIVGTMNYVFGIGLALWALAVWAGLRERALPLRLAVSTLFVLALFFCHLFSVGLYALGLFAFEVQRLALSAPARRWRLSTLAEFVATGLPFLPAAALLVMSPTWSLRGTIDWEFKGKLDGLVGVIEVYSHFAALLLTAVVAFAAGWGIRHRALHFHPFGWALLAVGGITYWAMPRVMFETYMADQRLPIALAFMVVACAHLNLRDDFVRRGFATVLVLLLAVRVLEVQSVWADLARQTNSFRESVAHIDRGAKVLVAYADPDGGEEARELWLLHAATLAIIERSALVTTAFTVVGKQILHVRDDYRRQVDTEDGTPPTVKQLLKPTEAWDDDDDAEPGYWSRWADDFNYLYVLFTRPDYENPDPARLTPMYASDRFVLYRIGETQMAGGSRTSD